VERRYVGIDLHRRRSVIYTMTGDGEKVSCVRIANDPIALSLAVADAGEDADVVIEATYGWYWAVDLLQADRIEAALEPTLGGRGCIQSGGVDDLVRPARRVRSQP